MLIDSHSHIHEVGYPLAAADVLASAADADVKTVCVMGDSMVSSTQAIRYTKQNDNQYGVKLYAFVGVHPHEAAAFSYDELERLRQLAQDNADLVKGIGEVGLDYYYNYTDHRTQMRTLEAQCQLALDLHLPLSVHVRSGKGGDAFNDFFAIWRNFGERLTGVLHSFTDTRANLDKVLECGMYVGVNGIITFNRDEALASVYRAMPLNRIVLETDAPYLAPKPYRGKVNQPAYVAQTAQYLATMRQWELSDVVQQTTANASQVYRLAA